MGIRRSGPALAAAALLAGLQPCLADSTSVNFEIANDRDPHDFGISKDMKYLVGLAHGFDNGVTVGGSFQYTDPRAGKADSQNLEATVGYRLRLNTIVSVSGSAGVGERFTSPDDFPYYVLRLGADLDVTKRITWNAIGYRYRNAFDTDNHYETPQVSTGISFKLDEVNSVSTKLYRSWKDGEADETGIALGLKHEF